MKTKLVVLIALVALVSSLALAKVDKVGMIGGPHDLRYGQGYNSPVGGTDIANQVNGSWVAGTYTLCSFCHIAHKFKAEGGSGTPGELLWNHKLSTAQYTAYSSHYNSMPGGSTTPLSNGDTSNPSVLCLSCHDGTVAINENYSDINNAKLGDVMIQEQYTIDPGDIMRTHPINFSYDATLATKDGTIKVPLNITNTNTPSVDAGGEIRLWNTASVQNSMQCSTCHEPHSSAHLMFRDFTTAAGDRAASMGKSWSWCLYCHSQSQA